MKRHISILGEEIKFSTTSLDLEDFQKYYRFVNNPFGTSVGDLFSQDNLLQEQFIDLVNDGKARNLFNEKSCSYFWIEMTQTYPDISKMALEVLHLTVISHLTVNITTPNSYHSRDYFDYFHTPFEIASFLTNLSLGTLNKLQNSILKGN